MRLCDVSGEPGETLLEALRIDHQHIDAPCGGRTRCVRCMVKVTEDEASALEAPGTFEAELVGHAGAHPEDDAVATILAKTLFHFFPFHPGQRPALLGQVGGPPVR